MSDENRQRSGSSSLKEIEDLIFPGTMEYIRANYRTATLADIARQAHLSPFHFHRRFTQWAGKTPKAIVTELQLEQAKTLLLEGRLPLKAIAVKCGFAHQAHFGSRFRMMTGDSPNRWLRTQRRRMAVAADTAGLDAETLAARAAA